MLANQYFKKRTYGFRSFFHDTFKVMKNSSQIREVMRSGRISDKFRERIMLAVTAVYGCIYCEWTHTKTALNSGCTEEEIFVIMENDFGSCDPEEVIALAFAQHYAETNGNPTDEAWNKLVEQYGDQKANDIMLLIKMVTVGNLLGNTVEAFASRFKGKPPENGSLLFELFVYTFGWPFILILNRKIKKKAKKID
ncbi:MAG: carboxymuconolactone decarboxylase family protein [Candidatus Heimdallarchaeaceae archaeon]